MSSRIHSLELVFCLCSLCPHIATSTPSTSKPGLLFPYSSTLRAADPRRTNTTSSATGYPISSKPYILSVPVHPPKRLPRLYSLSSGYSLRTQAQYSQARPRTLLRKRTSSLRVGTLHRLLPLLPRRLRRNSSTWRGSPPSTLHTSSPETLTPFGSRKQACLPTQSPLSYSTATD